jgi:HEPN domain-containing protein/predicted nucleotidyltransferase
MIQRTTVRDDVAHEVASRIADAIHPWRIVLFGSRARGDARERSDYDFYVEVNAADDGRLRDIHDRIRALFSGRFGFDFKVCRRGDLERRRDDPGTIEWDVAREGKVLYADPAASTEITPPDRVREPSPELPASMHEWLKKAERDLEHRGDLLATGKDYSPELCWLSHQTCEKYLKALLVARNVRPERTHNLSDLLEALRGAGVELAGRDADCKLLNTHAITPRYAAGLDLGEEDARAASDAADRIITAVRALLPLRVH